MGINLNLFKFVLVIGVVFSTSVLAQPVQSVGDPQQIAPGFDSDCDHHVNGGDNDCNYQKAGVDRSPDAQAIDSVPVFCRDGGAADLFGVKKCDEFIENVKNSVRDRISAETYHYYDGNHVNWAVESTDPEHLVKITEPPVCNLSNGELEKGFKPGAGPEARSCGELCHIEIDTCRFCFDHVKIRTHDDGERCDKEFAWIRGTKIQAHNHFKEKVLEEFSAKSVNLVEMGGTKACAEVASGVIQIGQVFEESLAKLKKHADEGRGIASDFKCNEASLTAQNMGNSEGAQAVCKMHMISKRYNAQMSYFLGCEIQARLQNDYSVRMNAGEWMQEFQGKIEDECENPVRRCTFQGEFLGEMGEMFGMPVRICNDSMKTITLNACYEHHFPNLLKDKLDSFWPLTEDQEEPKLPEANEA